MAAIETSSKDVQVVTYRGGTLFATVYSMGANIQQPFPNDLWPDDFANASIPQRTIGAVLSDQSKDGWIEYIRKEFYSIPEIEAIYLTVEESDVDIWLLIPDRDIGVVRRIAEKEVEILREFASVEHPAFLLEFHVIYRCGAEEKDLLPEQAIPIPK